MRIASSLATSVRPLERKLPLLIAALLCAVLGTFGWMVNRELRIAFERAAGDRLLVAAQRIAVLLAESSRGSRAELRRIAGDSAVISALRTPSEPQRAELVSILGQQKHSLQFTSRAVWTRDCTRLALVGPLAASPVLAECPTVKRLNGGWFQPLFSSRDTAMILAIVPVIDARSDTLGYVTALRSLAGAQIERFVSGLIGRGAAFMIGNASGPPAWTNLETPVAGPALVRPNGTISRYTPANGPPQLGVALNIASTPWVVWVQVPLETALAGQYATLKTLGYIALVCLMLGVLGAWMLGNHVTRPLGAVTRAAEDLARGDYSARVEMSRGDELGLLMTSFNKMAEQVQAANQQMSAQAEELGRHYRAAQDLAHELQTTNQELIEAAVEAKGAVEEKVAAQALLTEMLAQAPLGIAIFDERLRYVRLNSALAAMHGVPVNDHLGRTPNALAQPLATVSESCLEQVLATGEPVSNELSSGVGTGGARRHWLASYFPVRGTKGEVRGVAAIVLDTTTHHDLEAQLLQAQKMDAVGQLAGGVAHDFNNLLTVISSYSQMALETLRRDDPLYADMTEIRNSADRAARLTRQLLAFSRKQVMQPQTLDLNHVALEMENMLQRLIGEDVVLVIDLGENLGEVRADPGQIEQVLMNLAVNARDAMPDGGRLVISTKNVHLKPEQSRNTANVPCGDYVTLSVNDSGTGMSEETRAHLFEPFFTTKETGQGTGLGLSTVYGIVKQSGGEMQVQTGLDKGSTFTMYLPRLQLPSDRATRPPGGSANAIGGSETILLVEDDAALRSLARRILGAAGYEVLEACTANAAIEFGQNYGGTIDLLLTDVVMPQQNGRAVAARLRELRPGLQVLFMSGYTDDDVLRRGVIQAQSNFLQKPFTPEELTCRIRDVLDSANARMSA